MSDNYLRIIPRDPAHVPRLDVQDQACAVLKRLVPNAEEVRAVVHDEIAFIDQGENFENVRCPSCGESLDGWWQNAMDEASKQRFMDLGVRVPCCEAATSLNDLDYAWPAGFARFVLEAVEPAVSEPLDRELVKRVEVVLGQPVRQILARY